MHNRQEYALDNSGIIHLAIFKLGKSNLFRFCVTLTEPIQPEILQTALHTITPRFPTMVAGILGRMFQHKVIPVDQPPDIEPDCCPLHFMSSKRIKECAMRVLYGEYHIALEFFHSLTDGYGSYIFMKALLAEYLNLLHGTQCTEDVKVPPQEAVEDSFLKYAGKKKAPFNGTCSYLPEWGESDGQLHITTGIYDVGDLLRISHNYGVSLTTLLTAVMAGAVMELQEHHCKRPGKMKPVQIMVPVNLRKKFPSNTVRNFALYALPCMHPGDQNLSLEEQVKRIDIQLKQQLSIRNLRAMMATNVELDKNCILRALPLAWKCLGLKIGYHFVGKKNSSLSLSNLGSLEFPEEMRPFIRRADLMLSPRTNAPYNCGVVSCNGKLYINFSRNSAEPELERIFFRKIHEMRCAADVEVDGAPIEFGSFVLNEPSKEEHIIEEVTPSAGDNFIVLRGDDLTGTLTVTAE